MKKMIQIVFLFLVLNNQYSFVKAQNLVPNGSFEQYTQCPNSTAQLSYTGNWSFAGASTDYYNSCSPQGNMSVPLNIYGYQDAYEGGAYIGMITAVLNDDNLNYYREPSITSLTQPLIIGTKYYVSFKAALTINDFESCCASNKLGALFSTVQYSLSNPVPDNLNFAHVYTDSVISDTTNWTKISGSFIADSAYNYVSIGNFFDTSNTIMIDYKQNFPTTYASYYYIDDVRVSTDSLFGLGVGNFMENKDDTRVFPNPSQGVFTLYSDHFNETFKIFNSIGQVILTDSLDLNQKIVDLSKMANGIYIIQLKSEDPVILKLIIQN